MEKIRVLSIVPYQALKPIVLQVAEDFPQIELVANEKGLLEEGAELVKSYPESSYDAVLSRGGTKTLIEKVTSKPVFDIPISYYDLLKVFNLLERYEGKKAVVCHSNTAHSITSINSFFQHACDVCVIGSTQEAHEKILELKKKGYSIIIGDTGPSSFANDVGLQSMLLSSGPESVNSAFKSICTVFEYLESANESYLKMNNYLNHFGELLLILDQFGTVSFLKNQYPQTESLISACRDLIPDMASGEKTVFRKRVADCTFVIEGFQAPTDLQYYFRIHQTMEQSPNAKQRFKSIRTYSREEIQNQYSSSTSFITNTTSQIFSQFQRTLNTRIPLLITSESGLEKFSIAKQIFLKYSDKDTIITIINCASLTQKELTYLINDDTSPLFATNTYILFREVQMLETSTLNELIDTLKYYVGRKDCRLLFTYELSYNGNNENLDPYYINSIKNNLSCVEIPLLPLRSKTADIGNYAVLYVTQKQQEGNETILGIEPEAIDLLKEYNWPRNMNQLQHVLDEAFMITKGAWITAEDIRTILQNEQRELVTTEKQSSVALNGTLDTIMRNIVLQVLDEEKQNKTNTAKRLGIGRSTLWRIIQRE